MAKYMTGFLLAIEAAGIMAAIALFFVTIESLAETLTWRQPTTYSDGSPLLAADIQKTTIYCSGKQLIEVSGSANTVANAPPCPDNFYTAAVTAKGVQSAESKTVVIANDCPICNDPPPPAAEVWKTQTNGTSQTRPVYALAGFPDIRDKIGVIAVGAPCGDFVKEYSAVITSLTWRKVDIGDNATGPVIGVTVCKLQ